VLNVPATALINWLTLILRPTASAMIDEPPGTKSHPFSVN